MDEHDVVEPAVDPIAVEELQPASGAVISEEPKTVEPGKCPTCGRDK